MLRSLLTECVADGVDNCLRGRLSVKEPILRLVRASLQQIVKSRVVLLAAGCGCLPHLGLLRDNLLLLPQDHRLHLLQLGPLLLGGVAEVDPASLLARVRLDGQTIEEAPAVVYHDFSPSYLLRASLGVLVVHPEEWMFRLELVQHEDHPLAVWLRLLLGNELRRADDGLVDVTLQVFTLDGEHRLAQGGSDFFFPGLRGDLMVLLDLAGVKQKVMA